MTVKSGSLPNGLDETVYPQLITIAKEAGKKVILDTSGKLLETGIAAAPHLVKPNMDEIQSLTGKTCTKKEEIIAAAKEIHEAGIETVVVSLGEDGAIAVCREGVYHMRVPNIETVNTVGCGDSMIAGFAVGFETQARTGQQNVAEILRLAGAVSAASALREETGFFVVEDKDRLEKEIRVEKLYIHI